MNGLTLNGFQIVDAAELPSPENDMLSFTFPGLGNAAIDETARTISMYVPSGTDVSALAPTSRLPLVPPSPRPREPPITSAARSGYTVTAENGSPKVYTFSFRVPAPGTYEAAVTALRPLAYWLLDETTGTTALEYVSGANGVYQNNPRLGQPGATANTGTSVG